jgi:hypothetical protein
MSINMTVECKYELLFMLASVRILNIVIFLPSVDKLLMLKAEKTRYARYNVVLFFWKLFFSFTLAVESCKRFANSHLGPFE